MFFQVTSASLIEDFGETFEHRCQRSTKCSPGDFTAPARTMTIGMFVTLGSTEIQTDGKAIDKGTPGSFLIYGSHEAKTNDGHIIGRIKREDGSYQNHYTVKVAIPAEQFKSIASSIRHDKPPTTLSIETLGRTMDAGGTYLWDIKNQLPVVAISIHMGGRAISQKEIPPSELLANATRGIESKLGWLIALVATVGVLFLLYKH